MNVAASAWVWYYFNILVIVGIVYFLLAIMYQRSKRIIINTAEQPFKPDNSMLKLVIKISIAVMIWFFIREYGLADDVSKAWEYVKAFFDYAADKVSEVYNG